VFLLLSVKTAIGITCSSPDHWFLERVSLGERSPDLPPGIGTIVREGPRPQRKTAILDTIPGDRSILNSIASDAALDRLVITNSSSTALYKLAEMSDFVRAVGPAGSPTDGLEFARWYSIVRPDHP
jgi:hypothetical protein